MQTVIFGLGLMTQYLFTTRSFTIRNRREYIREKHDEYEKT